MNQEDLYWERDESQVEEVKVLENETIEWSREEIEEVRVVEEREEELIIIPFDPNK